MNLVTAGLVFKELRKRAGFSSTSFSEIGLSHQSLLSFETGKTLLKLDKLIKALELIGLNFDSFVSLVDGRIIFKRYSEVFSSFREQRNFEYSDFQPIGISTLMLSLFEEGKIMLKFDELDAALQLMHIPLSDFSYALNDGIEEYFIELYDELDDASIRFDLETIKKLNTEASNYPDYRIFELSSKSCLTPLTDTELEELGSYFFGIDAWTTSDIKAFILTLKYLETDTIELIVTDFFKRHSQYDKREGYHLNILRASLRVSFILTSRGDFELSRKILNLSIKIIKPRDEYIRLVREFVVGFYYYKANNELEGLEDMKKSILTFDNLGDLISKNLFQSYYNEYVLQNNKSKKNLQ